MPTVRANLILYPMFAQVLLTFVIWLRLLTYRVGTLARQRIHPQTVADESKAAEIYRSGAQLSDHYENLFEIPVLFYAAILTAAHLQMHDSLTLVLAWMFVALRVGHSIVHTTSNIIPARFILFLSSSLCVWTIWIRIVFHSV